MPRLTRRAYTIVKPKGPTNSRIVQDSLILNVGGSQHYYGREGAKELLDLVKKKKVALNLKNHALLKKFLGI